MTNRVLVLAPHADDETLGAGGAIAHHLDAGDEVCVAIATGPGGPDPDQHPFMPASIFTTVQSEAREAMKVLGVKEANVFFGELPAVTFPQDPAHEVNKSVHNMIARFRPNILYVPFAYDLHNDHRRLFHSASVAWRPTSEMGRSIKRVLSYEVQSETHWNGPAQVEPGFIPNVFLELTEEQLDRKRRALECYKSQIGEFPYARSVKAIEYLARWRGSLQGLPAAEAFILIKEVL